MNIYLARMAYIKKLHDKLFAFVYKTNQKKINQAIEQIAIDNQILLGADTMSFVFEDTWYPEQIRDKHKDTLKACNRILHPSLWEQVHELLHDKNFNEQMVKIKVKTLLGNILMLAKHTQDLIGLLPSDLFGAISPIDEDLFNKADPLPEATINEFLENNKVNFSQLHHMTITKLLLAKL